MFPSHDPDDPDALPVTFPVNAPANPVAVKTPDEELKVKLVPVLGAIFPESEVENTGKQVVSDDSSATVIVVAIAAVPEVFWLPAVLTPGRFMFPVPSNDTPPIFLAVSRAVAVAAFPVQEPDDPDVFPVTFPVMFPEKVEVIVPPALIFPSDAIVNLSALLVASLTVNVPSLFLISKSSSLLLPRS